MRNYEKTENLLQEQGITYRAIYYKDNNRTELGDFPSLKEAQKSITDHPNYKKSYFTKKGEASSNNPDDKERFWIFDSRGYQWSIRIK